MQQAPGRLHMGKDTTMTSTPDGLNVNREKYNAFLINKPIPGKPFPKILKITDVNLVNVGKFNNLGSCYLCLKQKKKSV